MRARPSLVSNKTAKANFGHPYQIYTESVYAGRNLQGTKKRVKWRFGWSDSPTEHEVEFVHSQLSGKKTIIEDGVEINSSTTVLSSDYSYGWNSEACAHVYRIEATLGVASEYIYVFSIDGTAFTDMQFKPAELVTKNKVPDAPFAAKSHSTDTNDSSAKSASSNSERRPISMPKQSSRKSIAPPPNGQLNNSSHKGFVSSTDSTSDHTTNDTFDPFSSQNSNTFDPFASDFGARKPTPNSQSNFASFDNDNSGFNTQSPSVATLGSGFDAFSSPSPSSQQNIVVPQSKSATAANSGFDMFATAANPQSPAVGFESGGFTASKSTIDVFTASNSNSGSKPSRTSLTGVFGSASEDDFSSKSRSSIDVFSSPATNSSATAANDPFFTGAKANHTTQSVDPFFSSQTAPAFPASAPSTAAPRNARRQSAQEIALDFAGLTLPSDSSSTMTSERAIPLPLPPASADNFTATSADKVQTNAETPPRAMESNSTSSKPADPWGAAKNLVNLDLGAQTLATANTNTTNNNTAYRRQSLSSVNSVNSSPISSVSFDSINPFASSTPPTAKSAAPPANPFGNTYGPAKSSAISSMQSPANPVKPPPSSLQSQHDAFQGLTSIGSSSSVPSATVRHGGAPLDSFGASYSSGGANTNTRASISFGSPSLPMGMNNTSQKSVLPAQSANSFVPQNNQPFENFEWKN